MDKIQQQSIIHFVVLEKKVPKAINKELVATLDDNVLA